MSMKLGITGGGSMEITDDNKTIVSADVAKEINDSYVKSDDKQEGQKPDLTLKD